MAIKLDTESDEALEDLYRETQQEIKRRAALKTLDRHPLIEQVHKAMQMAADELDLPVEEIRFAEIARYVDDIPGLAVRIGKYEEEWKHEIATKSLQDVWPARRSTDSFVQGGNGASEPN